jgi:hypothetical protein
MKGASPRVCVAAIALLCTQVREGSTPSGSIEADGARGARGLIRPHRQVRLLCPLSRSGELLLVARRGRSSTAEPLVVDQRMWVQLPPVTCMGVSHGLAGRFPTPRRVGSIPTAPAADGDASGMRRSQVAVNHPPPALAVRLCPSPLTAMSSYQATPTPVVQWTERERAKLEVGGPIPPGGVGRLAHR